MPQPTAAGKGWFAASAARALARMYESGMGVPRSKAQAERWRARAEAIEAAS